jgi:hypothetical protein
MIERYSIEACADGIVAACMGVMGREAVPARAVAA